MITTKDYYKGRDISHAKELTSEIRFKAETIMQIVNALLLESGFSDRTATSGWRPRSVQMEINPRAPNSKHVTGEAIDIGDRDQQFAFWCLAHQDVLKSYGLYMENPKYTPTWVHLQTVAPRSGRRVFNP